MQKKIRVLMVLGNTGRGGAQTFAINVLRNIDRDKFQIDFAVNEIKSNGYEEEMISLGSKIYTIPFFKGWNYFHYKKRWQCILKNGNYDIVHGHVSSSAFLYLKIAKKYNCKTIAHSHSAGYRGNGVLLLIKKIFTLGAKKQADYWFSCSHLAAIRLFGKKYSNYKNYYNIPNAIIAKNYLYNSCCRKEIRQKLGINADTVVFGHVGSFTAPKNHEFLIDVFEEINKINQNSVLLLVGAGELKEKIEKKVFEKKLQSRVFFLGSVSNVNEYMMAMDAMIFPSFFEGFPVTVIEAEATGLFCVISDTITNEICVTNAVKMMSLNESVSKWAKVSLSIPKINREKCNEIISGTKYNMNNFIDVIMKIYSKMIMEK